MSEQQASQRKIMYGEKYKKDFFQTPPACTRVLLNFLLEHHIKNDINILDPCCGDGAIYNVLQTYFKNIIGYDLFPEITNQPKNFLKDNDTRDLIIMNPPYSNKYNFIKHAVKISTNVFCLLPMQTVNYNMVHRDYMCPRNFIGKIIMTPKIMLHEGTEIIKGGVSSYAWFWWSKNERKESYSKEWYANLKEFIK